jgi:hypothetical protein
MKDTAYFVRREPLDASCFEEEYWGVVVDPDGNMFRVIGSMSTNTGLASRRHTALAVAKNV